MDEKKPTQNEETLPRQDVIDRQLDTLARKLRLKRATVRTHVRAGTQMYGEPGDPSV